jgi:hypothetical protein
MHGATAPLSCRNEAMNHLRKGVCYLSQVELRQTTLEGRGNSSG